MSRQAKIVVIGVAAAFIVAIPLTVLAAGRVHPGGRHHRVVDYIASVEGVSPLTLRQDVMNGETLLQIADGRYATASSLARKILAPIRARLMTAVAKHEISSAQAVARYGRLEAFVTRLASAPHTVAALRRHLRPLRARILRFVRRTVLTAFVSACDTTRQAARPILRAGGQTPLGVCRTTNRNITANALLADLVSAVRTRLDALASNHPVIARRESAILARVSSRLDGWVLRVLPARA